MVQLQRAAAPRFDTAALRERAGGKVFARGEEYFRDGHVELLSDDGAGVRARVAGSELYAATLRGGGRTIHGHCTCPANEDFGFCKHLVATALAANAAAERGETVPDRVGTIRTYLRSQGIDRLVEMLIDTAGYDEALFERLDLAATAVTGDAAKIAARCKAALARALRSGDYIDYGAAGDWCAGVLGALDQIEPLIGAGHANLVLTMLADFLPDLDDMYESVDDSNGHVGQIYERAAELHFAACDAARPDPVALARDLFERETTENYDAFAGASETYRDILGTAGLAEYRRLAEAAWDSDDGATARFTLLPILDGFAEADGDLNRRLALREAMLSGPRDYLRLANFCLDQGMAAEALRWAEAGARLFADTFDESLLTFVAARHRAAGAADKAEATLWPAFERRPSQRLYDTMADAWSGNVNASAALADRAVALLEARLAAPTGKALFWHSEISDLLVHILLAAGRSAPAWDAARRHNCAENRWMQLATETEDAFPDDALAVYARLAEAKVGKTNNGGYAEACRLIERMGALRARRRETAAHAAFVADMLTRHKAKRNFVAMLRPMLAAA